MEAIWMREACFASGFVLVLFWVCSCVVLVLFWFCSDFCCYFVDVVEANELMS